MLPLRESSCCIDSRFLPPISFFEETRCGHLKKFGFHVREYGGYKCYMGGKREKMCTNLRRRSFRLGSDAFKELPTC